MEAAKAALLRRRGRYHQRSSNEQQQQIKRCEKTTARRPTTFVNNNNNINSLDVVRALHQTVISLRTALDSSREEIRKLKEQQKGNNNYLVKHETDEITDRLDKKKKQITMEADTKETKMSSETEDVKVNFSFSSCTPVLDREETEDEEKKEKKNEKLEIKVSTLVESEEDEEAKRKIDNQNSSVKPNLSCNESENDSEEVDDIELIFTTEETTCKDVEIEDLVSITDTDNWQQSKTDNDDNSTITIERQNSGNETKTNSMDEAASSQSSSIDREESVDRFDESSASQIGKIWSQCSVLVETDISKCGVLEEIDCQARNIARRNTLATPISSAYRPIIHREALASAGRRKSAGPLRPIMDRSGVSNVIGTRRESGAQTDISALPAQWRSESYLAHKVAHAFTTLPSKFKFALPVSVSGSKSSREARRVMLSDISFTSQVPELSKSADHLYQEQIIAQAHGRSASRTGSVAASTNLTAGCCWNGHHRASINNRRESWARGGGALLPSPCECRLSVDLCTTTTGRYRNSLSSIPRAQTVELATLRRRVSNISGPTVSPGSSSSNQITSGTHLARPNWSSMPSSPTHARATSSSSSSTARHTQLPRKTRSKVTFQECPMIRGSLPNLRSESSGDSTESLIDEAEDYLRRSIDSMLMFSTSVSERCAAFVGSRHRSKKRARRHSEPDLFRDWNQPSRNARPYLPKKPQDLKINHLVKVITPEGRILQGRVRYVGAVTKGDDNDNSSYVGVELSNKCGTSDGTFNGTRYFDCEAERAIFVPFKKIVLAWC